MSVKGAQVKILVVIATICCGVAIAFYFAFLVHTPTEKGNEADAFIRLQEEYLSH